MHQSLFLTLNAWDWTLLCGAGYLAVVSLVRLMRLHRDQVLDRVRREMLEEQLRRKRVPPPGNQQAA